MREIAEHDGCEGEQIKFFKRGLKPLVVSGESAELFRATAAIVKKVRIREKGKHNYIRNRVLPAQRGLVARVLQTGRPPPLERGKLPALPAGCGHERRPGPDADGPRTEQPRRALEHGPECSAKGTIEGLHPRTLKRAGWDARFQLKLLKMFYMRLPCSRVEVFKCCPLILLQTTTTRLPLRYVHAL